RNSHRYRDIDDQKRRRHHLDPRFSRSPSHSLERSYPMLAEIRSLNEECGVFGIWGHPNAAQLSYYGLHALQHRGQEGAGIVSTDKNYLKALKGEGMVSEVFTP